MSEQIVKEQKIEIPLREYNFLQEVHKQFKRQALLLRIIQAEENLKKGKVKEVSADEFINKI